PVKEFRDLLKTEIVVGASGVATSDSVYARVLNQLVGTKFRIIDGYKDNPQMIMATESGEIMGRAGWFVSSLLSTQGQPLAEGKLRVLTQVSMEKHPELPNVPLVTDFISDPEKRAKLEFAVSWLPMGRPVVAPPGVPEDRLKILRDSYMATMRDPELLAEAKKMGLEISPMSGVEIQALLEKLYATPPAVIEAVREIMVAR
ncbi:MAG: tripartite tricarboxylate transporter family receptor, partial [Hyphomicrobiales bacterium]|nr:tripartite tricarboxylate transporter family receptor [Hyphomicrobiales bacterium]